MLFRLAILLLALLCLAATRARACGPSFPNNLLDGGDAALLCAPVARFRDELERMQLVTSRFAAIISTNTYDVETIDAELSDLEAALKKAKVTPAEVGRIREAHLAQREKLKQFVAEHDSWAGSGRYVWDDTGGHNVPPEKPAPKLPRITIAPGLPAEFADYLEGASAWLNPADEKKSLARAAWERLLARPAAERKFKSTWAAYMLGKIWEDEDTAKAASYFRQVRELARDGFADSTGLAAASLGWEARLRFREKKYRESIELYLEQLATGDDSAATSLQWVATAALSDAEALPQLAHDEHAQKVITAALISSSDLAWVNLSEKPDGTNEISANWLNAVEAAGVSDVDSAEKLALAAYQTGAFDVAQRWIKRAKDTTIAQWLQAKLYLRAGKLQAGAALLSQVAARMPISTNDSKTKPAGLADSLYVDFRNSGEQESSARHQVLGELGVLHLSRREFKPALDALLNADYWGDAAYVAERVLTTDELKAYVDQMWPAVAPKFKPIADTTDAVRSRVEENRENIRYLLARRLTRELRGGEAREYYPAIWLPPFDELVKMLVAGWNEATPAPERVRALLSAAFIARTNGMELLGTELAPDYHIWDGAFQYGVEWAGRATNEPAARINVATTNELQRAAQHGADPELRFHYRYQAAFMAGRAARMMPDNSDETAFVLCTAGSWLKDRDPVTADVFYKTLVHRCRKTALGAEADRLRWLPALDANGHFIPREPAPINPIEFTLDEETPMPEPDQGQLEIESPPPPARKFRGLEYTVEPGDTLLAIVKVLSNSGVVISVADVLTANPGLVPTKMVVGRSLIVPLEPLPAAETPVVPE